MDNLNTMNTTYRPKGQDIAEALGISPGRVSQLKADGMPVDSIEAARSWYRRRVDPARSFGQKHGMARRSAPVQVGDAGDEDPGEEPSAAEALGVVCTMALAFLEHGDAYLDALREAIDDVPLDYHRFIALPLEAWRALYGGELPATREFVLLGSVTGSTHDAGGSGE